MNIACLPKVINDLCKSFLLPEEIIYVNMDWNNFPINGKHIAIKNGWLDLLIWILNDYRGLYTNIYDISATYGQLEILKWLHEHQFQIEKTNRTICMNAAGNGHFEVLKWARENGYEWDFYTCANAAEKGNLEILKWARENGCDWHRITCSYAAANGHLEVLKYAHENGCDWDECVCAAAAENSQLEILKYAHKNLCPWDERVCRYAIENGNNEILEWFDKEKVDCPCKGKYHKKNKLN
jgi:hypothetical protein